jgi:hypothetical protein
MKTSDIPEDFGPTEADLVEMMEKKHINVVSALRLIREVGKCDEVTVRSRKVKAQKAT